jgi:hypothetical protein
LSGFIFCLAILQGGIINFCPDMQVSQIVALLECQISWMQFIKTILIKEEGLAQHHGKDTEAVPDNDDVSLQDSLLFSEAGASGSRNALGVILVR